jgi:hypothetical protein
MIAACQAVHNSFVRLFGSWMATAARMVAGARMAAAGMAAATETAVMAAFVAAEGH